ncbi:MAG: cation diffusion facilitator family transporter [candidate division Zixibacteria bacterium]|jgi:cobalt-zinc-cadmium efflux system protein|nr:cation diffusion facilitator family transporter [candidate division Zixibacteria bacterium]
MPNHAHHTHDHSHAAAGSIRVAFFLNLAFTIVELFGGLWTNSVAILSGAVHDLGDSLSLGTAWYLEHLSRREGDRRFSYGYRRFSVLGALINTIVLLVGSLYILSQAVPRLMAPEHTNAEGMIGFAVVGVLVNGLAVYRLRGHSSLNVSVVAWHLLEDVLGWVAVLVVGITLKFSDLHILDPILSILITLYILFNVVRKLKSALSVFLQAVPEGVEIAALESAIKRLDGVCSVHHTHVWSLDGEHHVLSTHVVVDQAASKDDGARIKEAIRGITAQYKLEHTTVEIEYEGDGCSMDRPA